MEISKKVETTIDCLIVDPWEDDVLRRAQIYINQPPPEQYPSIGDIGEVVVDKILSIHMFNKDTGKVVWYENLVGGDAAS